MNLIDSSYWIKSCSIKSCYLILNVILVFIFYWLHSLWIVNQSENNYFLWNVIVFNFYILALLMSVKGQFILDVNTLWIVSQSGILVTFNHFPQNQSAIIVKCNYFPPCWGQPKGNLDPHTVSTFEHQPSELCLNRRWRLYSTWLLWLWWWAYKWCCW